MFVFALSVLSACSSVNIAQNQSQSTLESQTITQTQPITEAPTELDREITPQDNVDKEMITLTEEQFKQFFNEDKVRILGYFTNDSYDSYSYDDIVNKYRSTKTVIFEGGRYKEFILDEVEKELYGDLYIARAYCVYKSPYGGYLYVYFITDNNQYWLRTHGVYRESILSYEDFGDLTGKTAEDVEKIDGIVKYYKAAFPDNPNETTWASYHLLEDGILEIYYDGKKNNEICNVVYKENYIYIIGPEHRYDFILEE